MKDLKVSGSGQLYTQFLFRVTRFKTIFGVDIRLGVFSPSQILNSVQMKDVRNSLINIGYAGGFMLQASNFADVADGWGISFTLWGIGNNETCVDVYDLDSGTTKLIIQGKNIHMLEKEEKALYWIKTKPSKNTETIPRFTSAINYDTSREYTRVKGTLATLIMDMGIVESNLQRCALMPSRSNANWSIIDVLPENFDKAMSLFTARRLIIPNWINSKDEYMVPDVNNPQYNKWQSDCIVYSLFSTASNQSSLRNIDYNGKPWNIYNEFFWLSREDMLELATDVNQAVYDDLINHAKSERFVYEKLQTVSLSDDAKQVLDMATAILYGTFKYRDEFNRNHPEYHINTWDAGWYQIKALAKEYTPNELDVFESLFKQFSDRLRPLVYELGFLCK